MSEGSGVQRVASIQQPVTSDQSAVSSIQHPATSIENRASSIQQRVSRTMVDILLIQPPIRDFYLTAKRTIPYGLTCIASALMDSGFSVAILDGLATSKSRIRELPEELSYLHPY